MRACSLCGGVYWLDGVEPLAGDERFCQTCAMEACEIVQDLIAHTAVGETKNFTYPRWVWEKAHRLFANGCKG